MKTIWKYEIPMLDYFELEIPAGAKILSVQVQGTDDLLLLGKVFIWALVDPDALRTKRLFRLARTGHQIMDDGNFIGTFQLYNGKLVYHLFDISERPS
jgi:hypothetical protein